MSPPTKSEGGAIACVASACPANIASGLAPSAAPESIAPSPGSNGIFVINDPALTATWFTSPGLMTRPFWITPPGTVFTMLCPEPPSTPSGAQPIHPGPEYQLTNDGEKEALNSPGIQK